MYHPYLRGKQNEIFSYFDCPVTNAYTETIDSVVRQVDRMGRGYGFNN